jgi:hypothetical protein
MGFIYSRTPYVALALSAFLPCLLTVDPCMPRAAGTQRVKPKNSWKSHGICIAPSSSLHVLVISKMFQNFHNLATFDLGI